MKINIPWQEKPENFKGPIWRYTNNPIIDRNTNDELTRVFNSSVVIFNGEYVGVFRAEAADNVPYIFLGRSKDGINFDIEEEPIKLVYEDGEPDDSQYQYDPRLIKAGDTYYIVYCDDLDNEASISIAYTKDFKTFTKMRHPFPPNSRNGMLFPEQVDGYWMMLYRTVGAHDGNIYYAKSKDLHYWGDYRVFMKTTKFGWGKFKIGAGCCPIKTKGCPCCQFGIGGDELEYWQIHNIHQTFLQ